MGELWTCVQQTHVDLNRNKEPAAEIARSVILFEDFLGIKRVGAYSHTRTHTHTHTHTNIHTHITHTHNVTHCWV